MIKYYFLNSGSRFVVRKELSGPNEYIASGATTPAARAVHIPPTIPYLDIA